MHFRQVMRVICAMIVLAMLLLLIPFASAGLIWKVSTRGGGITGRVMMTAQEAPMVRITQPNGTNITSPARIGNGVLYFTEAAVGRPAACIRGASRCEDNVFIRCVGGTWESVEKCRNSEVCTPGGCKMLRWSRYPFVKITPPGRAPDIRANLTSHEMPVQVDI